MKTEYILLLERDLAARAEHEGGLSELVENLLREHFQDKASQITPAATSRRQLKAYGMLKGLGGSVDEFIARKSEEKELER